MVWGFLSVAHVLSLLCGVAIIAGLFLLLRGKSDKTQITVLTVLSLSGICAIIFNLVAWNSPLEYLPFHLCSLNAMVLPFAVISRNKTLNNLLLLWSLGALMALVVNNSVATTEIFSPVFNFYYFPHLLEFGIPILMFALKLVKKDVKCILSTVSITASSYTVVHFINLLINNYAEKNNIVDSASNILKANYMYSLVPENPVLQMMYNLIPHPYWYMYGVLLIVVVYLGLVYLKDIVHLIRSAPVKNSV
jgi:uncharacterized membrane protein YwaF